MHIKHMHEMIEKLTDCTKSAIENDQTCVGQYPISDVVDMIKDLNEASYYASIVKAMEEAKKEDEEEEKHMLRMLKDEHKDEYKRMREEYGEDEGERRFYDNYRYKTTGRFAPKGRGSYEPRRSYEEPPYYHMTPEDYKEHSPEWYRDMDRKDGKMYFTEPSMTSNVSGRDVREGRSGQSRRSYMETKEIHKGNTPADKQAKMVELEKYTKELADDVTEMIADATPEERTMIRTKLQTLAQKIN